MGILEPGSFHLHPVCWDPQEPGCTHIPGEVSQPGPVDLRTNPGSGFLHNVQISVGFHELSQLLN